MYLDSLGLDLRSTQTKRLNLAPFLLGQSHNKQLYDWTLDQIGGREEESRSSLSG